MRNQFTIVLSSILIFTSCSKVEPIDSTYEPVSSQYDLGELPEIVTDIKWPVAPTLTSTITVSNTDELQAAALVDGASVVISSGTYASLSITCNDCEFKLANDATIAGALSFMGQRIYWEGGKVEGGPVSFRGEGDLLINNLHSVTNGALNNFSGATNEWNRLAIINSTFEVINGNSNGSWAFYIQDKGSNPYRGHHLIFANVRLESDAQNNRIQAIDNVVIIDSYFNSNVTSLNGLRMHRGLKDVYMRNAIIVGGNTSSGDETQITNGVFENITRYTNVNNPFSIGIGFNVQNVSINNSQCYTSTGNNLGTAPGLADATGENPGFLAWDATTVPNASSYGANH